jgi:hypothetical protein
MMDYAISRMKEFSRLNLNENALRVSREKLYELEADFKALAEINQTTLTVTDAYIFYFKALRASMIHHNTIAEIDEALSLNALFKTAFKA